jgi:hypothetical protein
MIGVTLERARAAKLKLAKTLTSLAELRGLGIAILANGYGVKVNLARRPAFEIPAEIDEVPVIVEIIGTIRS